MINKVSTVAGFMFLAALILLAVLTLDAVAAPAPPAPSSTTVNNTTANPVPTDDVDNPAKQPFAIGAASTFQSGSVTVTTVPAGKLLVIETITARGYINLSGSGLNPYLTVVGPRGITTS